MVYGFRYIKQIKQGLFVLCVIAILVGLYLTSLYSYLLFHTLSELFTIAIAFAMFIIVWNSRQFIEDNYLSFIGVAFLFIGSLDILHSLAYKGMNVFHGYDSNLATQLWVASRSLHSISFLAAAFFIGRKLKQGIVFFIYSVVTAFVLLSIFYWKIFPDCFIEGQGLTKFKNISEIIVCVFFVISILLLYLNRAQLKKSVLIFLFISFLLSIFSEFTFSLYGGVYSSANLIGHYLKIISFYLIYRALIKNQLIDPYNTLFRNLKQHEKFLVEEQKRLENILNAIPDGIYIVNQNHDIEYINPTMRKIFGSIDCKKCYEYIYSSDKPCSLCKFSDVLDGKTVRLECASTNGRVYDTIDTPFVNIFTGQASKLKILRDITDIKQAEQVLRQAKDELEKKVLERTAELVRMNEAVKVEKQRLNDVLEMLPAYAILLTPDYHVAFANRTFREWFGDDNGKKCYEFLFNRTEPCENCETYKVLKTNKPHHWEWTGPNGHNYDIFDFPFTDADGTGLIMEMGVDITEQKRAQEDLRLASLYSRSLIESSLDPLVTISADGKITDVNEATIKVTGIDRRGLIGTDFSSYFTEPQKAKEGYQQVFAKGFVTDYPLTICRKDGKFTDVLYNASVYKDTNGNVLGVFAAARDITKRKTIERKQDVINSLLELFAAKTSRKEYLDATTKVIKDWSGCEFIGIRIKDNGGNIPYESYVGFEQNFLELENCLNIGHDNCVCVQAILQNYPQHEYITSAKSFFCNDSNAFLKNLADEQKGNYRGNCIKFGFQSIAVVPVRYHNEIFGAIHIADFKKDMVSLAKVQFIESTIVPLIGEAVNRFNVESELRKHRLHLEDVVKQRTQDLRNSEERYRGLVEMSPNALFVNRDNRIEFVNPAAMKLFGVTDEKQILGKSPFDVFHPDCHSGVKERIQTLLDGNPVPMIEEKIIQMDGTIRDVEVAATPFDDFQGRAIQVVLRDITERKKNEEALRESENHLSTVFHASPTGIFITRLSDGLFIDANEAYLNIIGYSADEVIGHTSIELNIWVNYEDRKRIIDVLRDGGKFENNETKFRHKNGEVVDLLYSSLPLTHKGELCVLGTLVDITDRKKKEKELNRLNRTLRAISNSNQAMMYAKDESELFEKVCGIIIKDCGHKMVWIGIAEDDENKTVRPVASAGFEKGYLEALNITWSDTERGRGPTGMAIRTGKISLCRNMLTDPAFELWRKEAIKRGYASSIVFPLVLNGRTFGALSIYSKDPDPFTEDEVKLLAELAGDLSYGLASIRSRIERDRAEQAIKVSEVRYRRLFEAARDGILILNADTGQIVDVNPFLIEMLGFSHEEFLGKKLWEIGRFKNIVASKESFLELQSKGYIRYENLPLETKDGRKISVEFVSNVYLVDNTKVIQCNIRDITDRVLAENMMRESREDLNRAQAVAHIGSWRMDVQQNILTWSDENHRIFGVPKGTPMTYETFLSCIHPDDREMINQKWMAALKGESYDVEHRIVVDGQVKWVREIANLELDKDGVLLGGFGTTEDITDRKDYEEQINNLAKFPSENPFAVLRVEADGKIVYANNAGVELLKFWRNKLGQNVPADWRKLIDEALETRRNIAKEVALNNSVVSFVITPIHNNGYVNIYGKDITEYKDVEKKLQEVNAELETRVRQRTKQLQDSITNLQDEVFNRVKAEKELLENQDKLRSMSSELVLAEERERRELAAQLHDSIGQLLSFSKRELGILSRNAPQPLKPSLEKVWELVKQAVDQTRTLTFDLSSATLYTVGLEAAIEELAEDFAKDHGFKLHFGNDTRPKFLNEQFKVLLYRAVRELLINIAKHSKAYNVYIDILKTKDSIYIVVRDDGIGIDISGLESKNRKLKGFGLFSLQERLANIGGSIDIKSQQGCGTTVKLMAPLIESKGEKL